MDTSIVCCANQKGGAGKTTVTMGLAASLARRNYRVIVVDGDKQGSAVMWADNAPEEDPFPARVIHMGEAGIGLPRQVQALTGEANIILIDCPPSVESPIAHAALLISDLALIPVVPSPPDLAAAPMFLELVRRLMEEAPTLKAARVVPSMVDNTQVSNIYLSTFDQLSMPITETKLRARTSHRKAAALGTSVHTQKDPKAVAELEALTDEVLALLELPSQFVPTADASRDEQQEIGNG